MRRPRGSIRLKLTLATLVPLVTAIAFCWVIGASIITERIFSQAQQKVETDLNAAHEIFEGELVRLTDAIRLTGLSPELAVAMRDRSGPVPLPALQVTLRNAGLSFLTVTDRFGVVRYRAANPGLSGDSLRGESLVAAALEGKVAGGVESLTPARADRENPLLPAAMATPLRPTPRARPHAGKVEQRGMFLLAAAPLQGADGRIAGVVYGGALLNNGNALADRITRVLFRRGAEGDRESGSATLFLDDVRIATSVLDEEGRSATGSLMSAEVHASIARGEKWIGRAFVLNNWHFSAYEPVRDHRGAVIGALYVGMPERPYLDIRTRINLTFTGVLVFVTLIGIGLSAWLGAGLARPVRALEEGVRRIAAGEELPDIRVEGRDEIAALAGEFNTMKHRLAAREEENLALNRTLEQKVLERTAQLEEKSRQLLETQKELARAERLAGIGLLASGVAHEINNPLAIIRGNTELLQMDLTRGREGHDGLGTIMRQVGRIERIVKNLLAFSRESSHRPGLFPLTPLLDGILDQIGHQVPLERYTLERRYRGTELNIQGDEEQLRQVFTNLVLNGLQAMEEGGTLALDAAMDREAGTCSVTVTDSGPGLTPEQKERLFTPFFTTKATGTGLGLAVSYGIVKGHRGEIRVQSEPGRGAAFTVLLPLSQGRE